MSERKIPEIFRQLYSDTCIEKSDVIHAKDGFFMVYKSVSDILSKKGIFDFPGKGGKRLKCNLFFDDWFLYAVENNEDYTYGLLKLREQEYDAQNGETADGDAPGVTISFVSLNCAILISCLTDASDENRRKLNTEINRVVAYKGQKHDKSLKKYFKNPKSQGAYLVATVYTRHIASNAKNGVLPVPEYYKEIVSRSYSYKKNTKAIRLTQFIKLLNYEAGSIICDNEKIYIKNPLDPTEHECAAILATHTGNTSVYSFAAEVEYHARFLNPIAKIKLPFLARSVYDSAIRADMTVGDTELEGTAPFHKYDSQIVRRQYYIHKT